MGAHGGDNARSYVWGRLTTAAVIVEKITVVS